jgi:VWFA-related protein
VFSLACAALAQAPDAPFRVTVNLVQVDAVVTDANGKHVTDLKAGDFEVLQDGRPQRITHCTYIATTPSAPVRRLDGPLPPARVRREQVLRTIAVVVDDLGLQFENVEPIRRALGKFIDEQIQPGDMVAVLRTGSNIGAVQQFTTDKRKLHAAAERIQWNWQSRTGVGGGGGSRMGPVGGEAAGGTAVDTIRRLTFVANGLRQLPGHKSMVLFAETDVIPLTLKAFNEPDATPAVLRALDRLLDMTSRASVAIYGIDPRGVQMGLNDAAKESVRYLARSTGGLFLSDVSNDLSVPLKMVLDDQQGYYLLGYAPEMFTFDPRTGQRKFHKITVRVKRPGLNVRSHAGFFGRPDLENAVPPPGSNSAVLTALGSPFGSPDIEVGMTSLFFHNAKAGSSITTLVNVRVGDLTLREDAGARTAQGDIAVMVFGDNGDLAEKTALTFTAKLDGADYERAMGNGFLFTIRLPAKKPGPYDVRVAVRDKESGKVGTASQFVEVPVLKKDTVSLSGILLETPAPAGQAGMDFRGRTALRIFHPGETLTYAYQVYNPKPESGTRRPKVEAQVKLYLDGKPFFAGKPAPVEAGDDLQRLLGGGDLKIGPEMPPGEYVLEVTATDLVAAKENRTATRYIDFRVAP